MPTTNNSAYWYVLFTRTGVEEKVLEELKNNLGSIGSSFVPKKICVFRRQGKKSFFKKICFPGYIIIESDSPPVDFLTNALPVLFKIKGAYRFLYYGDDRYDIAMREDERIVLEKIFGKERCADISIGFKEGNSIRVVSGALIDSESKIVRINKNRKDAVISLEMFGSTVEVSVGIDIIEKA